MKRSALKRRTPLRTATELAKKKLASSTLKPRKRLAPRSRTNKKRPRNLPYMLWIKTLPCAVCGRTGSEAAHTGPRGLGQKSPDESCIPLCPEHHRTGGDAIHVLGPRTFESAHGFVVAELVEQLNRAWSLLDHVNDLSPATQSRTNMAGAAAGL